ncbi:MAG: aminotransferase class I/II-fold pyridoxal phosphate-dependent enzyme [Anaerolineae bacterium]
MTQKPQKQGTDLLYSLIAEARTYPDAIILGRGDPDFDTPPNIIAAAHQAMRHHHADPVPVAGLPALRRAIAERVQRINGVMLDPETDIVVTNGGQEALFLMIVTALSEGDEIIVPEPNYNTYHDSINFVKAVKVGLTTHYENNFRADPEAIKALITPRTKALLLVSPNNPTASVISKADLEAFVAIAQAHDLILIADDIYDLFIYDDYQHTSVASIPGAKERTLTLNALSKTYAMTGWRLGWVAGPADLMRRVMALKAALNGGTSIIAQYAGLEALTGPQDGFEKMAESYRRRRRIVLDALDEMGIAYGMPRGGQFVFADISFTGMGSAEFAQKVLSEQHVLVYPGAAFDRERAQYVRITFLQPEEKLHEGLERVKRVMKSLA